MKSALLCVGACAIAFVIMGFQSGLFTTVGEAYVEPGDKEIPKDETPAMVRAKFPQDLAPAARAQAVPQAVGYSPGKKNYKLTILKSTGALHPWQEELDEEVQAETVEQTELVLVVGGSTKTLLGVQTYANGAPPVSRYRWDLEASVVDPKTGKVLANRQFVNMPRGIKPVESWELTALGQPVGCKTVLLWLASQASGGFLEPTNPRPLVNVIQ